MKIILALFLSAALIGAVTAASKTDKRFTDHFPVEKADLTSKGTNRYFVLEPGYQLVLQGKEKGKKVELTITVLNETRMVDGVETRIIEERETENGQPMEVSRNFFAISQRTGDVFYFGEEVDMYKNGKITGHEGSWLAGEGGAHFGLMMPATPLLGARFHQELSSKAMDRAEILSLSEIVDTPAGKFTDCLKTEETTPLEIGREYKIYAAGIGIVQDGPLKLVKHGMTGK